MAEIARHGQGWHNFGAGKYGIDVSLLSSKFATLIQYLTFSAWRITRNGKNTGPTSTTMTKLPGAPTPN